MKTAVAVARHVVRLVLWASCLICLASATGCSWLHEQRDRVERRYDEKLDELVGEGQLTPAQRDALSAAFRDALDLAKPGWDWHQALGDLVDALVLVFLGAGTAKRVRPILRRAVGSPPAPAAPQPT